MKFGEWYESHKEDSVKWFIGMRSGWVFYGLPKEAPQVLRDAIAEAYTDTLIKHGEGLQTLQYCKRLLERIEENSAKAREVVWGINPDTLKGYESLKNVMAMLDMNSHTLNNCKRTLINIRDCLKEPTPPPSLENTEIREEYTNTFGERCLVLKGKILGKFWDLEEKADRSSGTHK